MSPLPASKNFDPLRRKEVLKMSIFKNLTTKAHEEAMRKLIPQILLDPFNKKLIDLFNELVNNPPPKPHFYIEPHRTLCGPIKSELGLFWYDPSVNEPFSEKTKAPAFTWAVLAPDNEIIEFLDQLKKDPERMDFLFTLVNSVSSGTTFLHLIASGAEEEKLLLRILDLDAKYIKMTIADTYHSEFRFAYTPVASVIAKKGFYKVNKKLIKKFPEVLKMNFGHIYPIADDIVRTTPAPYDKELYEMILDLGVKTDFCPKFKDDDDEFDWEADVLEDL